MHQLTRQPLSRLTRRHGFTLIELLVVVTIIAVLIAMLMPSLQRAIESGRRAVCASNLNQIGNGMLSYGSEYFAAVPIGYVDGGGVAYDSSYHMIWAHSDPHRYMMLGTLYNAGFLADGRIFYCPSQTNATLMHDTPWNRFDEPYFSGGKAKTTRSGYNVRAGYKGEWWYWNTHNNPQPPSNMARLQMLDNVAVAADIVTLPQVVDSTHLGGEGVNALRIGGSVQWVARKVFNPYLTPTHLPPGSVNQNLWSALGSSR